MSLKFCKAETNCITGNGGGLLLNGNKFIEFKNLFVQYCVIESV